MTRIPYRTTMPVATQALISERGNLNVYRALAHAGAPFAAWMMAGRDILTSPVLPTRLRELVILRCGHLLAAAYEIAQHLEIAKDAGVTEEQRAALGARVPSAEAEFDETERAALELTTQLITTATCTDEIVDRARELLGDEALLELLQVIARWSGLALMLNALDVDLDVDSRFTMPH